jgi:RNA polymerase sigma factor (sigma-70 family)
VRAWLVTVANNRLRTHERQARRRRWLLGRRRDAVPVPGEAASPDGALMARERTAVVRAALCSLDRRDREMLLLRMEGHSYREIALALRLGETSVGTLLSRAKAAFLHALREAPGASD